MADRTATKFCIGAATGVRTHPMLFSSAIHSLYSIEMPADLEIAVMNRAPCSAIHVDMARPRPPRPPVTRYEASGSNRNAPSASKPTPTPLVIFYEKVSLFFPDLRRIPKLTFSVFRHSSEAMENGVYRPTFMTPSSTENSVSGISCGEGCSRTDFLKTFAT